MKVKALEAIPHFFIVGRGRSGTTLLRTILNEHPNILIPFDSFFLLRLYPKYKHTKRWTSSKLEEFYRDLWIDPALEKWNIDKPVLKKKILQLPENTTFRELIQVVILSFPNQKNKESLLFLGDKNAHYSLHLNTLIKVFPKAKIIHITRDFRDNILSYQKVKFELINTPSFLAERWKIYNQSIEKIQKKQPHRFFMLKYENLVTTPQQIVQQLCDFLTIPYDEAVFSYYKRVQKEEHYQKMLQEFDFHRHLAKPIDIQQMNKWKQKMLPDTLKLVEATLKNYPLAKTYGLITIAEYLTVQQKANIWIGKILAHLYTWIELLLFKLPHDFKSKLLATLKKVQLFWRK